MKTALLLLAACCVPAAAQITFTPPSVPAGSATFNLTINGQFVFGTATPTVSWSNLGNANLPVVSDNGAQLVVTVPANLLTTAGTATITVTQFSQTISGNFIVTPVPQITSIVPSSIVAGSPAFQLVVNGANFFIESCQATAFCPGDAVVNWNGTPLQTVALSPTQITATVPAGLVVSAGTASITVVNPGNPASNAVPFNILAPVPVITSLSPPAVTAGAAGFTLTVNGSNLLAASMIEWNGVPLATTFISATQVTAAIPAGSVAAPGSASVTVLNPGGQLSNALLFTINYPVPTIVSITPSSTPASGPTFTLTVAGTGFFAGSVVRFNGTGLATALTGNNLTATVPAALIAQQGTASVTVLNPGQPVSNAALFTIIGLPTITGVSPSSAAAGDPTLSITVTGTNFQIGSTVLFNGSTLSTTFVSAAQLIATLPTSLLVTPGTSFVSVATPGLPNTGNVPFNVGSPQVTISSISPSTTVEGSPAFTLTVSGNGFSSATSVLWNGQPIPTTFVSVGQLTASVSAALVAHATTASVQAGNPGQPPSNGISFVVTPTPIAITSLSPASAPAGSPTFTLTITGSGFLSTVGALWNGTPLSSTFGSSTQFTAIVPAALVANIGTATIRAANGSGPESNPLPFTIGPPGLTITSLSPNSVMAGGPALTLGVTGTGFQSGAQVQWNGSPLATSFVSATQLSATVPANLTAAPGNASVSVASGGAVSNSLPFTVAPAALTLISISPNSAPATALAQPTLTATGTGFTSSSAVQWNGAPLPTVFVSATQLTATILSGLLAKPGTAAVTVANPGAAVSNALTFTINPASVALQITSLSPTSATAGGPALTLTVNGTGFGTDTSIQWNSTPLATTVVSPVQVTAVVPANLLAQPGTASIGATSGGMTAAPVNFAVTLPAPPTVTLSAPAGIGPAQQPPITFTLGAPYPLPLTGTVTLTFTPNALVQGDDPAIQFASGGRTLNFSVAANSLTLPALMVQTGTVAGTITLTLKLTAAGIDVTPTAGSTLLLVIPRQAPVIKSVTLVRNPTGLEVDIVGFATSRDVTQATFHFTSSGSLPVADFTVPLTSTFAAWYASAAAAPYGSQFTYAQVFSIQGSSAAITSVTVTLTNSIGASSPATSN